MKAYGYCRVSGLTQLDGTGIDRQRDSITAYAEKNGIELVKFYEEGFTGKELERPVFREMREDILANGVRTVIVEKLDRLARDLMVSETFIGDFKRNGIMLLSTMEPDLCSSDPSRIFVRQILSAVAEYDRAMLVSRMKAGKDRVRKNGKFIGGNRGYGTDPEHPEEVPIVAKIIGMTVSVRQRAKMLNAEGIKTRSGGSWHPAQVARIIKANK